MGLRPAFLDPGCKLVNSIDFPRLCQLWDLSGSRQYAESSLFWPHVTGWQAALLLLSVVVVAGWSAYKIGWFIHWQRLSRIGSIRRSVRCEQRSNVLWYMDERLARAQENPQESGFVGFVASQSAVSDAAIYSDRFAATSDVWEKFSPANVIVELREWRPRSRWSDRVGIHVDRLTSREITRLGKLQKSINSDKTFFENYWPIPIVMELQNDTGKESWRLPKGALFPLLSSAFCRIKLAISIYDSSYLRMIKNQIWTVGIQRDFGNAFHLIGDAYQLTVEPRDQSGRDASNNGRDDDYDARCIVAILLFACGAICSIYGARTIGIIYWRWILVGLLVAECGGLTWLLGWPWTWF
jgi:hypothetical protein